MSFNPYQNYGAGIAALGPVQAMSDRNEAQTYMANGGQMFASGGIARLAGGGLDSTKNALDKYKYDPVTQRYVLAGADEVATAMEEELLRKKREAEAAGRSGSRGAAFESDSLKSPWDSMSNSQRAAYYRDNPRMAAITQAGQKLLDFTFLGKALEALNPAGNYQKRAEARGFSLDDGIGDLSAYGTGLADLSALGRVAQQQQQAQLPDNRDIGGGWNPAAPNLGRFGSSYEGVGGAGTYSGSGGAGYWSGASDGGMGLSTAGSNYRPSSDSSYSSDSDSSGAANGGLMALAHGGMSHLGDYSDGGRLLRGPGDGVSDSIPATIGDKRPARLADGEFVVPARIVSELGNGSTEAGARKLYAMMDRIQKTRAKTVGKDRVAVNSRADKNLPA